MSQNPTGKSACAGHTRQRSAKLPWCISNLRQVGLAFQPYTPDDGHWTPSTTANAGNQISERHSKKGTVVFADGHIETVRANFGNRQENFDPTYLLRSRITSGLCW